LPTWSREATSDILSRINTYKYVKLVELVAHTEESAALTEPPGNGGATDEADTLPTWPRVAMADTQGPNEPPGNVPLPQRDNTAGFDWRVDLKDNNYKYDRLVEPGGVY